MDMGKKIRALRLQRDLTQEQLAEKLGVTAQAVSKWENNTTMPDIQLLPKLSVQFGVTIDELFEMSDAAHFERLEQMLDNEGHMRQADFDHAIAYLQEKCDDPSLGGEALTLLAAFCNKRADGYRKKAEDYAKKALEVEPEKKANHSQLNMATQAALWDWNCVNHHEQIAYYQDFMKRHSSYHRGYLWLADLLIADSRIDEASEVIDKMEALEVTYHVPLYRGWIAYRAGKTEEAENWWKQLETEYPDNWLTWSCLADVRVKQTRYEEAIRYYQRAIELEEKPRYIDNYESIAYICEIIGDKAGAIDAYRHVMGILAEDWAMDPNGESVQFYQRKIQKLV